VPAEHRFVADNLACSRAGRLIFEALSFSLHPGDALILRGANGTGKSSLLRILAGFLRPLDGRLLWANEEVFADVSEHRQRLHYVGHADAVKPVLSVAENLRLVAALIDGTHDLGPALEAFDLVHLADSPGRFLSSGQRRRLALARLAVASRPLWLLDEPGVGLDRANRARLEALIDAHRGAGGLCIIATHGDVVVRSPLVLDFDS
jgi:heme exporter protein A